MITGRLQEKKGMYYMIINLKADDGKWKPKWFSTKLPVKNNKNKAKEILRDKIAELEAEQEQQEHDQLERRNAIGEAHSGDKILFVDYMRRWLKVVKTQVEDTTFSGYRSTVESQVIPYFEPMGLYLPQVEARHIKGYYEYLMVERGLSANSVKHHHANIRKALQGAMLDDLIPTNPADKVEKPKVKPFLASVYNQEELNVLFDCVEGSSLEVPVKLAAYYGLRAGEVCGLRWSSIDFVNKTVTINHIVGVAVDDEGRYYVTKKNRTKNKSSYRTLPLIPEIERILLERKRLNESRMKKYGNSFDRTHSEYVCLGKLGALLTPCNLSSYFSACIKYYELKHLRFHDLRHSCASLLLANGVSMKEIQDWLGHSSYNTTANIYAHLDSSSKMSSANVIANVLGGNQPNGQQKIGA